jgi:hypothetical protein
VANGSRENTIGRVDIEVMFDCGEGAGKRSQTEGSQGREMSLENVYMNNTTVATDRHFAYALSGSRVRSTSVADLLQNPVEAVDQPALTALVTLGMKSFLRDTSPPISMTSERMLPFNK